MNLATVRMADVDTQIILMNPTPMILADQVTGNI